MKNLCKLLFLILIFTFISCEDGFWDNCTSLSGEYCSGVYSCSDANGDLYIEVDSQIYYCLKSLVWEDTYDCSQGYDSAEDYCYDNNTDVKPTEYETCYKKDGAGNIICYESSLMDKEQCNKCGFSYSVVECDSYKNTVIISGKYCY